MKKFAIAGPVDPQRNYFLSHRLDLDEFLTYIEAMFYFVLHAPRQTGKTTSIKEITRSINETGKYNAIYINIENAQAARDNVEKALISIIELLKFAIENTLDDGEKTIAYFDDIITRRVPTTLNVFQLALSFWAKHSRKPIILFIDEIDALIGDSLLSVLRQIRSGYADRPDAFPQSICLIGLRDVRDYRIWSKESGGVYVSTSSPFNVKARSLLLTNFSLDEVAKLYREHTQQTGQSFDDEAISHAFYLTGGQPWLVNALAYEAAFVNVTDRTQHITKADIDNAKNELIYRRDTHLDSLIHKLKEERVYPIIDAVIEGRVDAVNFDPDNVRYVRDLGLLKKDSMAIANPIYQEVIPRELTAITSEGLAEKFVKRPDYVRKDGSLNVEALLEAFYEFYRDNSSIWLEQFEYKESGPHLLLMAFLQRIINGGGVICREYALGRGRVDLLIQWQKQRIVLEIKVKHREKTLSDGLEQTAKYMDTSSATEGYLLIFDRDPTKTWQQKHSHEKLSFQNHSISVWQM